MAKKKIGFIDYFIDNWHSANYPRMIRESSLGDRFEVALAWAKVDPPGKKTIAQWCQEEKVQQASSLEQVVDESDCIVVLAPRDPAVHEELCQYPLTSGKPVYVDKTFSDSLAMAQRLFARAQQHHTPMFSSSALRFGSAMQEAAATFAKEPAKFVATRGGGTFHEYAVHQLEMLVMSLGTGARRVMHCGNEESLVMMVDYGDGRRGMIQHGFGFSLAARHGDGKALVIDKMDDFFPRFIDAMLQFFDTRQAPVDPVQTMQIMALLEAGHAALKQPDQWTAVAPVEAGAPVRQ